MTAQQNFKLFSGKYNNGAGLPYLLAKVSSWVGAEKIAPRSIGVEYVESRDILLISLGYSTEEAYSVLLVHKEIEKLDFDNLGKTGSVMTAASVGIGDVICHEVFVSASDVLNMIFMVRI